MTQSSGAGLVERSATIDLVDDVFDSAAGHLNAQHARLVSAAVWMLDHTEAWQGDGLWTAEAYVRWRTGVAAGTASKVVDIARRASEFPDCVGALQRGELSLDQLAPIVRHAPSWSDGQMAGLAPRCTVAQISKIARQYPWDLDVPEPEPHADPGVTPESGGVESAGKTMGTRPPDAAWWGWDDRGRFRLGVNVGAESGSVIEAALAEARDAVFRAANTGIGTIDTVDAVVEIAQRSLDNIVSPSRRNRYRVNIHIGQDGHPTDSRGRSIDRSAAEHICCDALIAAVSCDEGRPVSVGRSQHIVPDRTRRIVEHRDGGCRVPGCGNDRFVEVHHIIHWGNRGPTDTWNLICLCPTHHRLHHQGRLGIVGDADLDDGVTFTDANGNSISRFRARPEPPGAPPPPTQGTWHHPCGERLDTRWLHFNNDPNTR
jgi:hypothetical protein